LALEMMQPTSDGVNSITVCQPIVMMFDLPWQRDETRTIGNRERPGRLRTRRSTPRIARG
jgi:hypothetical protein